jgi:TonB family protein
MTFDLLASAALRFVVLASVVWLALRLIRVRNPHIEVFAWRLTLLAGLALPALLAWQVAPRFAAPFALPEIATVGEIDADVANVGSLRLSADTLILAIASIYFAISSLLLLRLVVSLALLWRICRAARPMPTPDDVRTTERMSSPATFGGVILLPADAKDWPSGKLDAVLAHERAHVRSRDGYWSWLAQFHAALFWFNPAAWWIRRRLESLAETLSDDAVLLARHDPIDYAALLLDFAQTPNSRSVAMSVAESNVPKRIQRLLARIPPASALPRMARNAGLLLMIPVVMFAASTTDGADKGEAAAALPPSTVRLAQPADPDNYYPAVAKAQHVTGLAVVEVDVDTQGQLIDARIVRVEPADPQFGFGDAALQVARNTRYENSGSQTGTLKFMVKFALAEPGENTAATPASPPKLPRIVSVANPDDYYPAKARRAKVPGRAVVQVAVDPAGKVAGVTVLEADPVDPDYGFGPAAERVARANEYANPHDETVTIKFAVKFTPRQ